MPTHSQPCDRLEHGGTVDVLDAREDLDPVTYADFRARAGSPPARRIVGGCCEVGPPHIAVLRDRLEQAGYQISGVQ